MGNSSSVEEDETLDLEEELLDDVDPDENLLDFSALFEMEALHKALLTVKEPPGSVLTQHKDALIKWLKSLVEREETVVNTAQFVDFLTSKTSKEDAMEAFSNLDMEGEGLVEVTWLLAKLKDNPPEPMQALQPCHELPGTLDVYLPEKPKLSETAKKVLQFIHRHRVDSSKLVMPLLSQVDSTIGQRLKLVEGRYYTLKQREAEQALLDGGDGGCDGEDTGGEKLLIKKCFAKIGVSTNTKTMHNLLNTHMDSYWQSNGSPRSHWIRIHMLPGVMIKELSVILKSSDDSYMPKTFTISVGNMENSLKEIKRLSVPRETTGKFVLAQNLPTEYRLVQVNIKACHNDGCDARIHGLQVKGCKFVRELQPSVLDTMAIWYLSIIGSTAKVAMPVAPQLRNLILAQSKRALSNLPPLSLSPFSPVKPEFISPFVMEEMKNFLTMICLAEDTVVDTECLEVLLSFTLAHGNVNQIIDVILILLENRTLDVGVASLLARMDAIVGEKLLKHAELLNPCLVRCDGGRKSEDHKAELIFSNKSSSSQCYISDKDKKVVTATAKLESDQLMHVTKVMIKAQASDQGVKAGLVLLSKADPATMGEDRLAAFGDWTVETYREAEKV